MRVKKKPLSVAATSANRLEKQASIRDSSSHPIGYTPPLVDRRRIGIGSVLSIGLEQDQDLPQVLPSSHPK